MLFPLTDIDPDDGDDVYPDIGPILYAYVPFGSVNVIVLFVDVSVVPFNVTDHDVPDANPVSVNATVYVTRLNVIETFTFAPFTVNVPVDGLGAYFLFTVAIVYEYVPFGSVNVIVLFVDVFVTPFNVTDHDAPVANPDSVNVIV